MARQKKWNNQGGSGWGDKSRKPKKELPNIPEFDKLPESNSVSFRISKSRTPQPNYRGEEVWIDWQLIQDNELPELGTYELDLDDPSTEIRDIPLTLPPTIPPDLLPSQVYNEYEIVIKYKDANGYLVLTISSGQAYAARNNLNDPRYDFSIIVTSSQSIQIGQNLAGTVAIIGLNNASVDPIFSVYRWLKTKLSIATNNAGDDIEPLFLDLPNIEAIVLPTTSFSWDGRQYDLFYGNGIAPKQICLHAIDTMLKFDPTSPSNAVWKWSTLATFDPLPLCANIFTGLPVVYISIAPGSLVEINPRNPDGEVFVFRLSVDTILDVNLPIDLVVGGTADTDFYTIAGIPYDLGDITTFVIPAGSQYIDIEVAPLVNASQTDDTTIVLSIVQNDDYEIGFGLQSVDLVPNTLPVVTVSIAPGSPSSIDPNNAGGQIFTFRISIDASQDDDLYVRFQYPYLGTADYTTDYVSPTTTFTFDGVPCYRIESGNTFVDIPVYPNPQPNIAADETIILKVLPNTDKYTIDINSQTVILSAIRTKYLIARKRYSVNYSGGTGLFGDPFIPSSYYGIGGMRCLFTDTPATTLFRGDYHYYPDYFNNNAYPFLDYCDLLAYPNISNLITQSSDSKARINTLSIFDFSAGNSIRDFFCEFAVSLDLIKEAGQYFNRRYFQIISREAGTANPGSSIPAFYVNNVKTGYSASSKLTSLNGQFYQYSEDPVIIANSNSAATFNDFNSANYRFSVDDTDLAILNSDYPANVDKPLGHHFMNPAFSWQASPTTDRYYHFIEALEIDLQLIGDNFDTAPANSVRLILCQPSNGNLNVPILYTQDPFVI